MSHNTDLWEKINLDRKLEPKTLPSLLKINNINFESHIIHLKPISTKTLDFAIAKKIACSISLFQNDEYISLCYFSKVNIAEKIKPYSKYFQDFLTEEDLKILYKIILSSKESPTLQVAASNAITILNYSNFNFKDRSLSGIKVPNSDLSGCNFINTNLENSDLSGSNLCNSYFYCSNLENCNLSNAQFGKLKPLKTKTDIFEILFSASGKYFACSTEIRIWETKTWNIVMKIDELTTSALDFSPCERYIALATEYSEICIWDIERKSQIETFKLYCQSNIAYSPCGNYLLAFSDKKGHLIDLVTKKIEKYSDNYIDFALFSKNGKFIIEVLNYEISLYDIKTLKLIGKTTTGGSTKCSCLTNNILILGDQNGELYIWNIKNNYKISWKAHINAAITSISTDSVRNLTASSSFDRSIKLWDLNTQSLVYQYHCRYFSRNIKCVLSSNLSLLAISCDKEILLLKYDSLIKSKPFNGSSSLIEYISISDDNKLITSIDKNHETIVWDIAKNRQVTKYTKKYKYWSNWIYRNRLRSTKNYEKFMQNWFTTQVTLFTISPCGRFFAYNYRHSNIYIVDIYLYHKIQTINPDHYVTGFLLSYNGKHLVTLNKTSGFAILWDIKSGEKVNTIKLSPNWKILVASYCAKYIAVSYDWDITIINTENSDHIIGKLKGLCDNISSASFFPSSWKYFAACGKIDRRILVWDVETKEIILKINGHLGEINYLSFHLDNNFLISASSDMTLKVWNIDGESEKDLLHWSSIANEFSAYKTSFRNAILSQKNQFLIESLQQSWE